MTLTLNSRDWTELAVCRKMDKSVFFPSTTGGVREAKAICATCPVSSECLKYAIDNDLAYGVWGGLGETDRERLIRARRSAGL